VQCGGLGTHELGPAEELAIEAGALEPEVQVVLAGEADAAVHLVAVRTIAVPTSARCAFACAAICTASSGR